MDGRRASTPKEAPIHTVTLRAFAVERHPVTNAQFAEFVSATGYVTLAEQPIDPALCPGVDLGDLRAGAMVFSPTAGQVDLRDWRQWWVWMPGASWRHPFGPESDIADRPDHPVVQVAYPMPWRMRVGLGGGCRPRPSGNTPPAAEPPRPMRGVTRRSPAVS